MRMTAQMPIRFTHIALGGDAGPYWASGFVSGSVTDAETVKQSAVYQGALRDHPEITNWATLCVVYHLLAVEGQLDFVIFHSIIPPT